MKKAIVIWGGWPGHQPEATARRVASILRAEDFEVVVSDDLAIYGSPAIHETDLLVPIMTFGEMDGETAANLTRAVRDGLGLAGFHAGLSAGFPACAAYHYLTGVTWVAHPGDIVDYRVRIIRPEDPLVAGIADFDYRSEQYYLHYDPSVEILAATTFTGEHDPATREVEMPVVFKRSFGKGRVYFSALGHVAAEFDRPQVGEFLRRGMIWAARR
jgi:type 1 glutamine amidotransferase